MKSKKKVIAIASQGGHWQQLLLATDDLRKKYEVVYVTTNADLLTQAAITDGQTVEDCNRNTPLKLAIALYQCIGLVNSIRPAVVISTGAAPGLLCLIVARLFGAHTIWLDSFANVERLSMSGKIARAICTSCLTQWEHLSEPKGPFYHGELL